MVTSRSAPGWRRPAMVLGLGFASAVATVGCGGGGAFSNFGGSPFPYVGGGTTTGGPGGSGRSTGGSLGGTTGTIDPCNETQSRKFVRISMRNQSTDYIHYFLVLVAFVQSTEYPDGAVCPDDVGLYTSFGYVSVPAGSAREFGNYCIVGPALYYFHRNGQFRGSGGSGGVSLASAIAPAQGSGAPTYDGFFTSAGASVPVPDLILFHNPGIGAGSSLKISRSLVSPCSSGEQTAPDPVCRQDAFYYVDENDLLAGSRALGFNSGRRVPDEIQGTGCSCGLGSEPWAILGASNLTASTVSGVTGLCNVFLRGGRIDYVFVRDDTDPPYPQLVWQVTDASGSRAHTFDSRAGVR